MDADDADGDLRCLTSACGISSNEYSKYFVLDNELQSQMDETRGRDQGEDNEGNDAHLDSALELLEMHEEDRKTRIQYCGIFRVFHA